MCIFFFIFSPRKALPSTTFQNLRRRQTATVGTKNGQWEPALAGVAGHGQQSAVHSPGYVYCGLCYGSALVTMETTSHLCELAARRLQEVCFMT